jgi:hypothetical protein
MMPATVTRCLLRMFFSVAAVVTPRLPGPRQHRLTVQFVHPAWHFVHAGLPASARSYRD